jgi:hypothetical protein
MDATEQMKQTIAFFGDSFVGGYFGWIEDLCEKNNYQCLNIGKMGADPIFVIEEWDKFNNSGQAADVCIYAHTCTTRLYYPDKNIPFTQGNIEAMFHGYPPTHLPKKHPAVIAAKHYYDHLDFESANRLKTKIIPMGVDRYIEETNKAFKKIIHMWSFAPYRYDKDLKTDVSDSSWGFDMHSGTNIVLDFANLSIVEPGWVSAQWDSRPNHFSKKADSFIIDLMLTAIAQTPGTKLDFMQYINKSSKWEDYVDALKKIKEQL